MSLTSYPHRMICSAAPLVCLGLCLWIAGCASDSSKPTPGTQPVTPKPALWSATIDNIEACSCPAFCQCYFTGQPALHHGGQGAAPMRYCRFNNAFRVTSGHYADTKLDGMVFWMGGDLGGDFSTGQMDWCVLRFEPSATLEQRKAAEAIVHAIFPVQWKSFTVGPDAAIQWNKTDDGAVAKLNGGKSAEIVLKQNRDAAGNPAKIEHVQFWAARNNGFLVMTNDVEAYRDGDKPFEFKKTNGFFTTIEMSSDDLKPAGHAQAAPSVQLMSTGSACCGK